MLIKKIKILIFILNIQIVFLVKPKNICLKTNSLKCVIIGKNNCEPSFCPSKYSYQCGSKNCATDLKSCEEFQTIINNLLKLIISPVMYNFRKEFKMENFFNKISNCPNDTYKWSIDDVCAIKSRMRIKSEYFFKGNIHESNHNPCYLEPIKKYNCGKRFCTLHKMACMELALQKNSTEIINKLNKCKN
jgi:hypothetical protein